jgi:ribulose 1,5-bisphosphate synthetase/thiazole synthase
MSEELHHDVVVVGAGLACALAAYVIDWRGHHVALADRRSMFPDLYSLRSCGPLFALIVRVGRNTQRRVHRGAAGRIG